MFPQALAMRQAYIFNHWNQFDLLIIALAAVDIAIDRYFKNIMIVRMFKMFRLVRGLRLVKVR